MELAAKTVDTIQLPVDKSEIIVYDSKRPGLGVRIREDASRMLVLSYNIAGRTRRLTLGPAVKKAFPVPIISGS